MMLRTWTGSRAARAANPTATTAMAGRRSAAIRRRDRDRLAGRGSVNRRAPSAAGPRGSPRAPETSRGRRVRARFPRGSARRRRSWGWRRHHCGYGDRVSARRSRAGTSPAPQPREERRPGIRAAPRRIVPVSSSGSRDAVGGVALVGLGEPRQDPSGLLGNVAHVAIPRVVAVPHRGACARRPHRVAPLIRRHRRMSHHCG